MEALLETTSTMEGHFAQNDVNFGDTPPKNRTVSLSGARNPKWFKESVNSLYAILALGDNWDSYGAKRFSAEIASAATAMLTDIMQFTTPAPQIIPSANGCIQLEWHLRGIHLEIEVESLLKSTVSFSDSRNEELEWEGEIDYDFSGLVHYINLLTDRA